MAGQGMPRPTPMGNEAKAGGQGGGGGSPGGGRGGGGAGGGNRRGGRAGGGPRDATRGGVNRPALPGERGRESPLWIDRCLESLCHGGTGYAMTKNDGK